MTAPAVEVLTRKTLLAFLMSEPAKNAIAPMRPKEQTHERIVREVMNASADNPQILECTLDSIIQAVSKAVTYDLEIGSGVFLIPRKDKARDPQPRLRAQLGYKGKIELMLRYRAAKFIDYHCRYANEHYRCEYGTNPFIEHRPIMDREKRGALVGAYAFAQMTQVHSIIVEMDRSEIDEIRRNYSVQWKTKTVWENNTRKDVALSLDEIPWYCEGRVVHRLSKKVPMRGVLASLMADDGDDEIAEDIEVVSSVRREIGAGAAEPIATASGPGMDAMEAPVGGERAEHSSPF